MPSPNIVSTGIIDLILQAGIVAKFVLLVLLVASVFCWAIIFAKARSLKIAIRENDVFLEVFWQSKNLDEVFAKIDKYNRSPVAEIFKAGFKELRKLPAGDLNSAGSHGVETISRALSRTANLKIASFEHYVSWLATTASAAPFIGLFGTVWGIMNAFQNIGATGAANLAIVAPGISEALITTAAGLAAAIPAVVAYNHLVAQIKRLAVDMDTFSQDFLNLIHRSLLSGRKGS